ncbi:collagen alpha-1(I) chain-like [Hippopotamus amphibius kiboko]|uniref:collagen alpha-1(I) chain-like n=1 Tax=Hippopotamus amphibius kiboko TaxID=575201 RepID=UPI002594D2C3|nr:collagen alpha-1(I) chain-like [Hippopotamus amphibius kiboko]
MTLAKTPTLVRKGDNGSPSQPPPGQGTSHQWAAGPGCPTPPPEDGRHGPESREARPPAGPEPAWTAAPPLVGHPGPPCTAQHSGTTEPACPSPAASTARAEQKHVSVQGRSFRSHGVIPAMPSSLLRRRLRECARGWSALSPGCVGPHGLRLRALAGLLVTAAQRAHPGCQHIIQPVRTGPPPPVTPRGLPGTSLWRLTHPRRGPAPPSPRSLPSAAPCASVSKTCERGATAITVLPGGAEKGGLTQAALEGSPAARGSAAPPPTGGHLEP